MSVNKNFPHTAIPQIEPYFDLEEEKELIKTIKSGWISPGPRTKKFEEMVAKFLGAKYAAAAPNGTLAITLACKALDIGFGDEVIVPDLTMAGSANGVILAGGVAVFVDIRPSDLTIDVNQIEKKITSKTKAIIPVHLNGRSSDMQKLRKIAKAHKLAVIEDAAQALGSKYEGKYLGTIGEVGCFSFSVPKIVTTGQGGMVVTNKKGIYKRILKIRDQGRRKAGVDIHDSIGFNFRFTDLQAAVGLVQMGRLRRNLARKKKLFFLYKQLLNDISQVRFIETNLAQTAPWFIDIFAKNREKLIAFLKSNGVGVRIFYPPMHEHKAFKDLKGSKGEFPNTERASRAGLWLPSSVTLTDNQVKRICLLIKQFYQE